MNEDLVRCKHRKKPPGDGGVVDGCGWQGLRPSNDKCPSCGSSILYVIRRPMERDQVAKRLEEVMRAAKNFMEVADVPVHLRNNEVYGERRAELNTVASLKLHELLPAEDAQLAYITLAKEVQTLLVILDESIPELNGVIRRVQFRDSFRRLNALVGKALAKEKA